MLLIAEVSTFAGQARVKPKPVEQPADGSAPVPPPYDPNEQYADGAATTVAKFNRPSAVAVDKANNVFVCDFSNNRIRKVTPDGVVSTFAGSGEKGYKDGASKEAAFNWPNHICIDKSMYHILSAHWHGHWHWQWRAPDCVLPFGWCLLWCRQ